jgi:acyl-CoA synthetase (AMP-forming)/AMP-acid ligase II
LSAEEGERRAARGGGTGTGVLLTETVGDALRRQARVNGTRRAVLWEDGGELCVLTYAQLLARAGAVAHQLGDVAPGDRVAVRGRNCVEWVLLEYACAARRLTSGGDVRDLACLLDQAGACPPSAGVETAAPFLLQFTSGTTGRAKGALLSHRSVLNGAYLRERRDPASGGVCLNSVPYHHIGGSLSVILGALVSGGAFVVVDRFDPDQTVRLLALAGVTHLGGVPLMIERVLDRPGLAAAARTLKTVALGGADTSPRLIRRIRGELGAAVHTTYGQSECPIVSNSDPSDDPEVLATTAGRPVEETEVRIIDPATGEDAAPGEAGEIAVRSPLVMRGYFRAPGRTAEVLPGDGFLRTGDLGSIDADGYLTIRGRSREVIIRGGENIDPAEVEAALAAHPGVAACAVVGVAGPAWGELVGAAVVTRGGQVDPAELEAFLTGRIAHFKIPRVWRFTDGLPVTAAGKIRRTQVKEEMSAPVSIPDSRSPSVTDRRTAGPGTR